MPLRKSLEKSAAEKTNRERYEPVLIMKYTETVQRRKIHTNDKTSETFLTALGDMISKSKQLSALPPSKPLAGIRFAEAKTHEEMINRLQSKSGRMINIAKADKMLAKGPANASAASFL